MKKKIAALVLAASMAAGTGLTVCAAPNVDSMAGAAAGQEITGDASMNLPTIAVTVPTTADIVINPFQMEYEADGEKHTDQIICIPQEIVNDSNVAIAVNVTDLTVKDVTEGIIIATAPVTDKVTTKSAFLYLEVVEDGKEFTEYNSRNTNQIAIPYYDESNSKSKMGAKDELVVLGAKPDGGDGTKALFAINGSVVANPTVVNEDKTVSPAPWESTDTLKVSFKFTFTPQIQKPATP